MVVSDTEHGTKSAEEEESEMKKDRKEMNEEKLRDVTGGVRFDFDKARRMAELLRPETEKKEQGGNKKE